MDAKSVSRMLGLLKYRAGAETNKKGQDIEEAKEGLEIYQTLCAVEKKQFLEDFESNGRGRKKGSLSFVLTYKKKFSQEDAMEISTEENFYTLAQILEMNGLKWGDFKKNEAQAIGLQLVEDNKQEHGHDGAVKKHEKIDLLDKYYYIKQGPLVKKRRLVKEDELEKWTDKSVEIQKLGLEGHLSLENIGDNKSGSSSSGTMVKQENPSQEKFLAKLALLKVAVGGMQKLSVQGSTLHRRFLVVGRTDEAMKIKGLELQAKMDAFNQFLDKCATKMIENDEMDQDKIPDIAKEVADMEKLLVDAEHHTGGCKEMLRRFNTMLGK